MKAIGIKMVDLQPMTAGSKNTVVTLATITGFEANGISSCVKPENYDANIGKKVC